MCFAAPFVVCFCSVDRSWFTELGLDIRSSRSWKVSWEYRLGGCHQQPKRLQRGLQTPGLSSTTRTGSPRRSEGRAESPLVASISNTLGPAGEMSAERSSPDGVRVNLLTYIGHLVEVVKESSDGGSEHFMQYYEPTEVASSDASNGDAVPDETLGHDVSEVASTPLCAMCHQAIGCQCERCSVWVCGLCGIEGGHESYGTRFHIWHPHPSLDLGDTAVEVADESMTASTSPLDLAWSSRASRYCIGDRLDGRCILSLFGVRPLWQMPSVALRHPSEMHHAGSYATGRMRPLLGVRLRRREMRSWRCSTACVPKRGCDRPRAPSLTF